MVYLEVMIKLYVLIFPSSLIACFIIV